MKNKHSNQFTQYLEIRFHFQQYNIKNRYQYNVSEF